MEAGQVKIEVRDVPEMHVAYLRHRLGRASAGAKMHRHACANDRGIRERPQADRHPCYRASLWLRIRGSRVHDSREPS